MFQGAYEHLVSLTSKSHRSCKIKLAAEAAMCAVIVAYVVVNCLVAIAGLCVMESD